MRGLFDYKMHSVFLPFFSPYFKVLVNYNLSKFLMEEENNLLKSGIHTEILKLFVLGFDVSITNYSGSVCICSSYQAFYLYLVNYK